MEYIKGETLRARLTRCRGQLSMADSVKLGAQLADTLAAAHAEGIVHRDLKPDNVMIVKSPRRGEGERTKLLDFGIAKLFEGNSEHIKTKTTAVMGTPVYMSPEQCMGKPLDGRADMYSVGCLIYEALCGRKAFWGRNPTETMMKHVQDPPDLTTFDKIDEPWVPQMKAIIAQCLAKDPSQRFENMGVVKSALLEVPIHRKAPRAVRGWRGACRKGHP